MSAPWAQRRMIGFDTETTGVDTTSDRIVTASLIVIDPGSPPAVHSWLVDPGVDIPDGAAAVHGISTEHAREHGMAPARMLDELGALLDTYWTPDVALVAYNGSFDLTLYDHERARHGLSGLDMTERHLVDPLVIDRAKDRYRKGGRKLSQVCQHYGVELRDAHTSDADTLATLRLAYKMAARFLDVGNASLPVLADWQRSWHRDWAMNMAGYLRREAAKMEGAWTRGSSQFVETKMAALKITEPLTAELVAATVADTRGRADSIAAEADHWPTRPRVLAGS